MRYLFGLGSILITVGIILWLMSMQVQHVATLSGPARNVAEQIAGVDTNLGGRVSENIALESVFQGGKVVGIRVKSVAAGSAFTAWSGIQANDIIDFVGPQAVRDINDAELAKALVLEAYQRKTELGVWRNNVHYALPSQKALLIAPTPLPVKIAPDPIVAAPNPAIPPQPTAPANPAAQPKQAPYVNPLYRQRDAIQGAAGAGGKEQ